MSSAPTFTSGAPPSVPNVLVTFPLPHVMLVTLSRPGSLNAIPTPQHAAMSALWDWYDAEPCLRCAVLTGRGRAFCAGADLKEWDDRRREEAQAEPQAPSSSRQKRLAAAGFGGLSNRSSSKKPIIAAVNGLCLGGGMEIILNCDIVISSSTAKFGLPEVRRGVVALAGALPRLIRTVGKQRASEMALLGRMYDPREMMGWGIVNSVVVSEQEAAGRGAGGEEDETQAQTAVVKTALLWASEIASNSPDAVIVSKEGLRLGWEGIGPDAATMMVETGMYGRIDGGENMVEGVRSFVEKRAPRWVGSKL